MIARVRCALLTMLLVAGCGRRDDAPHTSAEFPVMGTLATVAVPHADRARLPKAVRDTEWVMRRIESKLSTWIPGSEASRLNRAAGGDVQPVGKDLRRVLELSLAVAECSDGCFDPTVGPLMALWGFRGEPPQDLPDPAAVRRAMEHVGYRHIRVATNGVRLDQPGVRVDFGAIGKGYAVDEAFHELSAAGLRSFLLNLGGNLRCRGRAHPDRPWRAGVRHPFVRDRLLGSLDLASGMALATSGNYEKFVTLDGRRYAHIMDPRTGRPVEGMAGVTVLSPSAAEADAMSTALFVAGLEQAPAILNCASNCEALLVPDRKPLELYVTPGFRQQFTPLPAYRDALRDLPATPGLPAASGNAPAAG